MKKRLLSSILFVGVTSITFLRFYHLSTVAEMVETYPEGERETIESSENPSARMDYEFMMLRDPKTGLIPTDIRAQELKYASTLPTRERVNSLGKGDAVQTSTWVQRGPYNVGGRTRALAYDLSDASGNTLLAGGVSGGMWRSTDGGVSWLRRTSTTDTVQSVTCLAQDTRSGRRNIWYYGTGEYVGNSASGGGSNAFYSGDGIYKSTDGGLTWAVLPSTHTAKPQVFDNFFDYVWGVAINPANTLQDEVYAATYGAIWRSTNGGTNWTAVRGASSPYSPYADVAVTSTGVVYGALSSAGGSKGIWRSTDGVTWTNITPGSWPTTYNRVVIGIAPSNENDVYFLANTPGSGMKDHSIWKYTYLSGDGSGSGGSWSNRSANIPAFGGKVGDFDSQTSYDLVIRVKPDDENVVFIGGTNLYRSTDGFATSTNTAWVGGYAPINNISSYTNHHPDQHAVVFMPGNSSVILSGCDGGISKTTNCLASTVAWNWLDNGYYTTQTYNIAIDHGTSGNNVIVEGLQDNGVWMTNSTDAVTPWTSLLSGDGTFCAVADGRSSYYISTQNGSAYRMMLTDNGSPAQSPYFTKITPSAASGFLFVSPFVLDPNNSKMMYFAAGSVIWRNSDLTGIPLGSNNSTSVNWDSLSVTYVPGAVVTALAVSRTPSNRLYYGTSKGGVYRVDGANTGQPSTHTDLSVGAGFPANAYVSCIAVDLSNADNAIVVFSNYSVLSLFSTTNGGSTWTSIGGNLEQNPDGSGAGPSCRWATIVNPGSSTTYFVGTSTGLYSTSALNGISTVWAQEGASTIGNVVVSVVDARRSDGLVVAATHGNGVFSTILQQTATGITALNNSVPKEFYLSQNYPDPFNPSTTIEFGLPLDASVTLRVYDIEGRQIATLADGKQSAGTYTYRWNGKNDYGVSVSSGVYFYVLKAGTYSAAKKMVLLK